MAEELSVGSLRVTDSVMDPGIEMLDKTEKKEPTPTNPNSLTTDNDMNNNLNPTNTKNNSISQSDTSIAPTNDGKDDRDKRDNIDITATYADSKQEVDEEEDMDAVSMDNLYKWNKQSDAKTISKVVDYIIVNDLIHQDYVMNNY